MYKKVSANKTDDNQSLSYKDNTTGNVLYGYSQQNLDKLVMWMKYAIVLFSVIGVILFSLYVYIFYVFVRFNILTKIIQSLR